MTTFQTIDELAEYIMELMKGDETAHHAVQRLFDYNVRYEMKNTETDLVFVLCETQKKLISTLPTQVFYGNFYTDRDITIMHIDLFVITEVVCVYTDIKFIGNFDDYEIIYSDQIEDIMNESGKNIYEFDDTDWDIVKFRTIINEKL